jgi:hypothetical protein
MFQEICRQVHNQDYYFCLRGNSQKPETYLFFLCVKGEISELMKILISYEERRNYMSHFMNERSEPCRIDKCGISYARNEVMSEKIKHRILVTQYRASIIRIHLGSRMKIIRKNYLKN